MLSSHQNTLPLKRLLYSAFIPLSLLIFPWAIHIWAHFEDSSILAYGLRPWNLNGLAGIFTMPFLHGNTDHLISNSIPFFVLGSGLFYFYREISWKVILLIIILSGTIIWFIGNRGTIHIGASGVIYGMAGFHLTSGIIRRNRNLMAFALLVVFLYGGLIWSIFPDFFPGRNISWEGHLAGLLSGVVLAVIYRNSGPGADPDPSDIEEEDDDDNPDVDLQNESDIKGSRKDDIDNRGNISTTFPGGNHVRYHVNE